MANVQLQVSGATSQSGISGVDGKKLFTNLIAGSGYAVSGTDPSDASNTKSQSGLTVTASYTTPVTLDFSQTPPSYVTLTAIVYFNSVPVAANVYVYAGSQATGTPIRSGTTPASSLGITWSDIAPAGYYTVKAVYSTYPEQTATQLCSLGSAYSYPFYFTGGGGTTGTITASATYNGGTVSANVYVKQGATTMYTGVAGQPITVQAGSYTVECVYSGQTLSQPVTVVAGGSYYPPFAFTSSPPFDPLAQIVAFVRQMLNDPTVRTGTIAIGGLLTAVSAIMLFYPFGRQLNGIRRPRPSYPQY